MYDEIELDDPKPSLDPEHAQMDTHLHGLTAELFNVFLAEKPPLAMLDLSNLMDMF